MKYNLDVYEVTKTIFKNFLKCFKKIKDRASITICSDRNIIFTIKYPSNKKYEIETVLQLANHLTLSDVYMTKSYYSNKNIIMFNIFMLKDKINYRNVSLLIMDIFEKIMLLSKIKR